MVWWVPRLPAHVVVDQVLVKTLFIESLLCHWQKLLWCFEFVKVYGLVFCVKDPQRSFSIEYSLGMPGPFVKVWATWANVKAHLEDWKTHTHILIGHDSKIRDWLATAYLSIVPTNRKQTNQEHWAFHRMIFVLMQLQYVVWNKKTSGYIYIYSSLQKFNIEFETDFAKDKTSSSFR